MLPTAAVRGLTACVELGRAVSSPLALAVAARAEGLVITAGPRFAIDGAFERYLRVPFSHPAEYTDRALDVLQRAWAAVVGGAAATAPEEYAAVV